MHTTTLSFDGTTLVAGTARFERRWTLSSGALTATSLTTSRDRRQWLQPDEQPAIAMPGAALEGTLSTSWTTVQGQASPVEASSHRGTLEVRDSHGRGYRLHVKLFPDFPGITMRMQIPGSPGDGPHDASSTPGTEATGIERDGEPVDIGDPTTDLLDHITYRGPHVNVIAVDMADQTDAHETLSHERCWRNTGIETVVARTCIAALEDPLTGNGLLWLKHAPLPHARPVPSAYDMRAGHWKLWLCGHGAGSTGQGYAWTVMAYTGGRYGRAEVLHRLQRLLRVPQPGLDGAIVSNTWGDRNRDGRICEEFVAAEIAADAKLGIDACQVDDGWMRGVTSNSVRAQTEGGVWEGYYASNPRFWQPHQSRFPNGMLPTAELCRTSQVGLSLWFGPDSSRDFANWERDAVTCLNFWRHWGVRIVKVDGIKARTKTGEVNLRRFFDKVIEDSRGQIMFDLDITAETRPGYFGAMDVGCLFVENRYTDWRRYWPHATLRNLWMLSWYVSPQRLRMEFLNPLRNTEKYGDDPLAPSQYPYDALFAMVMVASPLGFFEASSLPLEVARAWTRIIAIWKDHRTELHSGTILPIGECPDGAAWTGFCSKGYGWAHVVVFRQLIGESETTLNLPIDWEPWRATRIAGRGEASILPGNALRVSIPHRLDFCWVRLQVKTRARRVSVRT